MQTVSQRFVILAHSILSIAVLFASDILADEPAVKPAASAEVPEDLRRYPLGDSLRVLAEDSRSPAYRKLVDEMLATDLAAEWQRVETQDNAERFLEQHGGREKVLADAILRPEAYERRLEIRDKFLDGDAGRIQTREQASPVRCRSQSRIGRYQTGRRKSGTSSRRPATLGRSTCSRSRTSMARLSRSRRTRQRPYQQACPRAGPKTVLKDILWRTSSCQADSGNSSPVIWGEPHFFSPARARPAWIDLCMVCAAAMANSSGPARRRRTRPSPTSATRTALPQPRR